MILISNEVQIIFITGPNKKRNTGVLLKHLPYGKSKIPIASIERIKAVTSNEAGMYVHSAIAIYTIQNGLQTNLHHFFLFAKSFTERKSLKTIDLVTFVKQVFEGIYVNLLGTFKNSSFTTDFFMKDYCG